MAGKWVAEIVGLNTATDAVETLLFARGAGISFTDHATSAKSGLLRWEFVSQGIEISPTGTVRSVGDGGEIAIANQPLDIEEAGPWDHLPTWSFRGREAKLYWLPGRVWADRVLTARAIMEQPVANLSVAGSVDASITFPLRDPRAALDAPLQTTKYLGDNVAPAGVEGAEDLKGQPKPIAIGVNSNVTTKLVNASKLIYQLHDKAATVLCVRDGAYPLTAGASRADVAAMEATAPTAGRYDYCSISTGTYVRLGSPSQFKLCFDLQTGAAEANRTHAQVWKLLRTERCGTDSGDIDAASVTAMDTAAAHEVGFYFAEEATRRDAIDRVLASLSGYERQNLDGTWTIGRIEAPSGTPVLGIVMVTPTTAMTSTDRALTSLARARPTYAPEGSPPCRMSVRWGRNNTVMGPSEFAGGALPRLKEKFATEWRVETATDPTVWDPDAETGDFPNAPELVVETGFQPGADGLTCPHAATEAARLLALYSNLSGPFEAGFKPKPGDAMILPGDVVQLTYPGHDLDAGPLFLVLQSRCVVEGRTPKTSLLLGFGTPA